MKAKSLNEKDLNSGEIEFLKRYNISIDEVIDVTGMVRVGQKRAMEAKNARIAINGGRCSRGIASKHAAIIARCANQKT